MGSDINLWVALSDEDGGGGDGGDGCDGGSGGDHCSGGGK